MSYRHVRIKKGRIGELILNRPDARNAMSPEMGREVARAVAELNDVRELRVVLVRGAGKAFSAGGDFSLLEERTRCDGESNRRAMREFYELYLSVLELHVPTIAVVHGPAMGAGLCLAMACDIRLAATGVKLGANFVRIGIHPGMGATYFLPRLVGRGRATELLLTGRLIDAEEACRIGLVSSVHEPSELEGAAMAVAEEIATAAPIAVAQARSTLSFGAELSLATTLEREAACQAVDYASDDLKEAVAAFRDRRAPEFKGR